MYHQDRNHPFTPKKRVTTNFDVRYTIKTRIKGLEFDIATLSGGIDGKKRNAKAIHDLQVVLDDYKKNLENVPDNDEPFDRDAYVRANER